jgi:acetylornithine deacetylase/succinyl-diaminopimelate desuccinylase-like protein
MPVLTTLAIPTGRSWYVQLCILTAILAWPANSIDAAATVDYRPLAREMLQELIEIKSSDPFKLIEREGYFYGRGTQDMKSGATILAVNFIRWKQQGWVPSRDLILALTADEEVYGDEDGVDWLLKHHRELIDAEYSLNTDCGDFLTKKGMPYNIAVSAGEKKEVILQLVAHNRGGHSSQPREDNAIYELNAALDRIAKLKFPTTLIEVTRAQFAAMSMSETGEMAADMKAVTLNVPDPSAVDRLSQTPFWHRSSSLSCHKPPDR